MRFLPTIMNTLSKNEVKRVRLQTIKDNYKKKDQDTFPNFSEGSDSHSDFVKRWDPDPYFSFLIKGGSAIMVFLTRTTESFKKWRVTGEVERVLWNHFDPYQCIVSTDAGTIHAIDVRLSTFQT